jgi:predicted methyltransferase
MDTNQLNAAALITESKIIVKDSVYEFNGQLADALAEGWSQHGAVFAIGNEYVVNVVKYDPRYIKLVNTMLAVAALQIEELGDL